MAIPVELYEKNLPEMNETETKQYDTMMQQTLASLRLRKFPFLVECFEEGRFQYLPYLRRTYTKLKKELEIAGYVVCEMEDEESMSNAPPVTVILLKVDRPMIEIMRPSIPPPYLSNAAE